MSKKLKNNILPFDESHMKLDTTTIPYLSSEISLEELQQKKDYSIVSIKNQIKKDLLIVFNSLNDAKIEKINKFPIENEDKKYWLNMIKQFYQLPKNRMTDLEKFMLLRKVNTIGRRYNSIKAELKDCKIYFQSLFEDEIELEIINEKIFIKYSSNKETIGTIEDFISKVEKIE